MFWRVSWTFLNACAAFLQIFDPSVRFLTDFEHFGGSSASDCAFLACGPKQVLRCLGVFGKSEAGFSQFLNIFRKSEAWRESEK